MADEALREFSEKDLAAIHDVREIEAVHRLRNHQANWLATEKILQTRDNGANGLISSKLRKALSPIVGNCRILDRGPEFMTKVRFKEEPAQIGERSAPTALQKCSNGVVEHACHLIAPGGGQAMKGRD